MPTRTTTLPGAWWALSLLTFTYVFSLVDRYATSVLVDPLKADLGLSDIQIGLLQGVAFSVFYAIAGLPLGRLADIVNRKALIAAGTLLWSVATAFSGLASSFAAIFLARVLVGVGEASLTPAAMSMFSDMFPRDRLGRAIGIYTAGAVAGAGAALAVAGLLLAYFTEFGTLQIPGAGSLEPWRATFLSIGLPGVPLALLILFSLREPSRSPEARQAVPLAALLALFARDRLAFAGLFGMYAITSCIAYGIMGWSSTYLSRTFSLDPGEAGMLFGAVVLSLGVAGPIASGAIMDALQRHGRNDRTMRVAAIFYGIVVLGAAVGFATGSLYLTLTGLALVAFGFTASFAFPLVELQRLAPASMRGLATAINLTIAAIVGISLGPLLIPVAAEYLFAGRLGAAIGFIVGVAALLGVGCSLALSAPLARARSRD